MRPVFVAAFMYGAIGAGVVGVAMLPGLLAGSARARRERVHALTWLLIFALWPLFVTAWSVNAWRDSH